MHEIDTIYRVQVRGSTPYNFSQIIGDVLEIQHIMIVGHEFINSCHQLSVFVLKDQSKKYLSNHLLNLKRVYVMKRRLFVFYKWMVSLNFLIWHYKVNMPYWNVWMSVQGSCTPPHVCKVKMTFSRNVEMMRLHQNYLKNSTVICQNQYCKVWKAVAFFHFIAKTWKNKSYVCREILQNYWRGKEV